MYFLALFFITLLALLGGELLLFLFKIKTNPSYRPLISLLLGTIAIPTFYALIITGGKTVHLGFILLGLLAWVIAKNQKLTGHPYTFPTLPYFKSYLLFTGILVAWFSYFYCIFNGYTFGTAGQLSLVSEDVIFYSLVGEQIHQSGVENVLGTRSTLDNSFVAIAPYHYFEIYFGQFIANTFGLNALHTHIYCTNSFSVALISYTLWVFVRAHSQSKWLLLFCILAPFCSGIQISHSIPQAGHYMFNLLEMNTFKYSFLFLFFLLGILLAWQKNNFFPLPIMALAIMNYALFPVVLIALGILYLASLIYYYQYKLPTNPNLKKELNATQSNLDGWVESQKHSKWNVLRLFEGIEPYLSDNPKQLLVYTQKKNLLLYGLGGFVLVIFLFGIYSLWGLPKEQQFLHLDIAILWQRLQGDWQTSLNIIVGSFLYFWIDYIPFVLVALVFAWYNGITTQIKKIPLGFALLPLFFLGGAVSYSLLRLLTTEAFQPHSIGAAFVGNTAIILVVIWGHLHFKKGRKLFLGFQFIFLTYNISMVIFANNRTYNQERFGTVPITSIQQLLEHIPTQNPRIATLDNKENKHEVYPSPQWLPYYCTNALITSINPNILEQTKTNSIDNLEALKKLTPFHRFASKNTATAIPKIQLNFLKHHAIDYVLVTPDFEDTTGLLNELPTIVKTTAGNLYQVIQ